MVHKTLIGGTAYKINGGKTLVNGTAYNIIGGKTLVDDTSYELRFTVWKRYNLSVKIGSYTKVTNSSESFSLALYQRRLYSSYSFSPSDGFYGTGNYYDAGFSFSDKYLGFYVITTEITPDKKFMKKVGKVVGRANAFQGQIDVVETATAPITSFVKGEYIDDLLSKSTQELPSSGDLIEGGISSGYCVMYDDNGKNIYYYELS